jgi:carbohydrate-selective porin OprB
VLTLYTGVRFSPYAELLFDVESAGGGGLGNALGLAGFTNLDVVRNPTLGSKPYVARAMLHFTIPLSPESVTAVRGPLALNTTVPARRLEIRAGKLSTVDFFDLNSVGSDSHLQFMNWTTVNSGAYDYAADTRGYTYGVLMEYYAKRYTLRFGEMLMPKIANGLALDFDVARARAENVELELHPTLREGRQGAVRLLSFVNHADMGNYREAIDRYLNGTDPVPDITAHPRGTRLKRGLGVNAEQEITETWRAFGRFSWNDGKNESFAYTEVDQSFLGGTDLRGKRWRRDSDKVGLAVCVNGISGDHRRYLQLGGQGFLLGDGNLSYGHEKILEAYYTFHIIRGLYVAADLQRIWNPGYNQDRGPVTVFSFRVHVEDGISFGHKRAVGN